MTALKTVYDPEIPADIYEIGLIYRIDIADNRTVKVDMSLTSPNCPSAQELPVMVQNAVSTVPGVGKGRCQRGLGPALGPEPDVGRGARRPQHVVSYLFIPKPPHCGRDSTCYDSKLARRT